uniref:UORF 3 n=1 Tax=Zea mays TaxID=4577 RepID=Q94IJ1_MAIZE|nr:uORF 3 [Zea mays]
MVTCKLHARARIIFF